MKQWQNSTSTAAPAPTKTNKKPLTPYWWWVTDSLEMADESNDNNYCCAWNKLHLECQYLVYSIIMASFWNVSAMRHLVSFAFGKFWSLPKHAMPRHVSQTQKMCLVTCLVSQDMGVVRSLPRRVATQTLPAKRISEKNSPSLDPPELR